MSTYNENILGASEVLAEIQVKNNPDLAVVDMNRVRGGFQVVPNTVGLLAIPADLLKEGVSQAYVESIETYYVYRNGTWQVMDYLTKPLADLRYSRLSHTHEVAALNGSFPFGRLSGVPSEFASIAHTHVIGEVMGLQAALDGKAPVSHTHTTDQIIGLMGLFAQKANLFHQHTIADVTNLQGSLDGKSALGHTHTIGEIGGLTTELANKSVLGHTHVYSSLSGIPATFAPSAHVHAIGDVTGLQGVLDGKSALGHVHTYASLTGIPATFAPSLHVHAIGDVTGLQGVLDGKSALGHVHTYASLTGIPATFAPSAHVHTYASLSGIPATFAPSAHVHAIGEVTGLQGVLDGKSAVAHVHTYASLTGIPATFAPSAHVHTLSQISDYSQAAVNYWTKSGNDLSYSGGKIGIGIANPSYSFHAINGSIGITYELAPINEKTLSFLVTNIESTTGFKYSWRNDNGTPRVDGFILARSGAAYFPSGSVTVNSTTASVGDSLFVSGNTRTTNLKIDSLTTNYLPKVGAAGLLGDSQMRDNGTNVLIGGVHAVGALTLNKGVHLQTQAANQIIGYNLYANELTNNRRATFYLDDLSNTFGLRTHYSTGGNQAFKITVANSDRLVIDPTGNVGIGTGIATPNARLTVVDESNSFGTIQLSSFNNDYFIRAGAGSLTMDFNAHIHRFYTSGTEKVRITNEGRVGIGIINPTRDLTLKENAVLGWRYTTSNAGSFHRISGGGANPMSFVVDYTSGFTTPTFEFNGAAGSRLLTILQGGNVGIGTANPTSKLHVNGTITAGVPSSVEGGTMLTGAYSNGTLTNFGSLRSSSATYMAYGVNADDVIGGGFVSSTGITIGRSAFVASGGFASIYVANTQTVSIGTALTMTEALRVAANGNVGIGTTNPLNPFVAQRTLTTNQAGAYFSYPSVAGEGNGVLVDGGGTNTGRYVLRLRSAALADVATFLANGNVGIGTNVPNDRLHVDGSATFGTVRIHQTGATSNLFIGSLVGLSSTGTLNTAIGIEALVGNTVGNYHVALGHGALRSNTTGVRNVAIGYNSQPYGLTAFNNTTVGMHTMLGNGTNRQTGSYNSGFGYEAIRDLEGSAADNTAIGGLAMQLVKDQNYSIALGRNTMASNNKQYYSIGIGTNALQYGRTTSVGANTFNIGVGISALQGSSTLDNSHIFNIALGAYSQQMIVSGRDNISLGFYTMRENTAGQFNIGLGSYTYEQNQNNGNTGMGHSVARFGNHTASTYMGYAAALGSSGDTADNNSNTGIGYNALYHVNGVSYTTAIGRNSGLLLQSGINNTFLGYLAGSAIISGNNNIVIGGNTASRISGLSNWVIISDGAGNERISVSPTGLTQFLGNLSSSFAPTIGDHLTNKLYVDNAVATGSIAGINVQAVSTSTITLSGLQTIDGYVLTAGKIVLATANGTNNGLWIVAAGAWTRHTGYDTGAELKGSIHFVENGTVYAGYRFQNSNQTVPTVGSDVLTYVVFSGTENDPVFTAHAAFGVTSTKINNWDLAYSYGNHATMDYITQATADGKYVNVNNTQNIIGVKTFLNGLNSEGALIADIEIIRGGIGYGGGTHDRYSFVNYQEFNSDKSLTITNESTGKQMVKFVNEGYTQIFDVVISNNAFYGDSISNKLRVDSNIEYSGLLKPKNVAGVNGQFFKSTATGDAWADISIPDVAGLQGVLDGKSTNGHVHTYASLTGIPATFAPSAHVHTYASLTGIPTTFAPSAHTHTLSQISDYSQAAVNYWTKEVNGQLNFGNKVNVGIISSISGGAWLNVRNNISLYADPSETNVYIQLGAYYKSFAMVTQGTSESTSKLSFFAESQSVMALHQNGRVSVKTLVDNGLADFQVAGSINQSAVVNSLLKADANGTLVAATASDLPTHVHAYSTLTGIPTTFAPSAHVHAYSTLTGIPTTFAPSAHVHAYSTLTGIPTTFTPSAHVHAIGDVTGLQGVLDGKSTNGHVHTYASLTGIPATFAPSAHTHDYSTLTGIPDFATEFNAVYATKFSGFASSTIPVYSPFSGIFTSSGIFMTGIYTGTSTPTANWMTFKTAQVIDQLIVNGSIRPFANFNTVQQSGDVLISSGEGSGTQFSPVWRKLQISDTTGLQAALDANLGHWTLQNTHLTYANTFSSGGDYYRRDTNGDWAIHTVQEGVTNELYISPATLNMSNVGSSVKDLINAFKIDRLGDVSASKFTSNTGEFFVNHEDMAGLYTYDISGFVGFVGKANSAVGGMLLHNAITDKAIHVANDGVAYYNSKRILLEGDVTSGAANQNLDSVLGIGSFANDRTIEFRLSGARSLIDVKSTNDLVFGSFVYAKNENIASPAIEQLGKVGIENATSNAGFYATSESSILFAVNNIYSKIKLETSGSALEFYADGGNTPSSKLLSNNLTFAMQAFSGASAGLKIAQGFGGETARFSHSKGLAEISIGETMLNNANAIGVDINLIHSGVSKLQIGYNATSFNGAGTTYIIDANANANAQFEIATAGSLIIKANDAIKIGDQSALDKLEIHGTKLNFFRATVPGNGQRFELISDSTGTIYLNPIT